VKREIAIDGKTFQVELTECPVGSPFTVKINNKTHEVTLEHEPDTAKSFLIKIGKKSYKIELQTFDKDSSFPVKVNNIPFKAEFKTAAPKIVVTAPSPLSFQVQKPTTTLTEGAVVAPMAGKIVSIKVKKGDTVKMGTVLCVLEAMKMENEITAPKSGVVAEILAQEGKAVNDGDTLVILK